jgi:hypothetical protein
MDLGLPTKAVLTTLFIIAFLIKCLFLLLNMHRIYYYTIGLAPYRR